MQVCENYNIVWLKVTWFKKLLIWYKLLKYDFLKWMFEKLLKHAHDTIFKSFQKRINLATNKNLKSLINRLLL